MKILIGTTNPSKVKRFEEMLNEYDVEFLTLKALGIKDEPDEYGRTPVENAEIKAEFYGRYYDYVICNDSGLYIDDIPLEDDRQPGLNIRTPDGIRLNDDEMLDYYSKLVESLNGKVLCYYLDGIAVYNKGKVCTFMEKGEAAKASAFYMVSKIHPLRHIGWPLDSISINRNTNTYFVDKGNNKYDTEDENIMLGEYRKRLVNFFVESLGLKALY